MKRQCIAARWLGVPVAVLVGARAGAQADGDLPARLRAAAREPSSDVLGALLRPPAPLQPLLAALAADSELTAEERRRAFSMLADWRRPAIARLWHAEPESRIARAELFAQLPELLLERHVLGDERERRDAETVAGWVAPWRQHWSEVLREDRHERHCRSAEALQRSAARAARAGKNAAIESLRRVGGGGPRPENPFGGDAGAVSPFALADLLADGDSVVRTRAMAALRNLLNLPLPAWLAIALAHDPAAQAMPSMAVAPPDDASVPLLLAAIARGEAPLRLLGDLRRPPATSHERLAWALLTAGLQAPIDPLPHLGPAGADLRFSVPSPGDLRAAECFGAAMSLDSKVDAAVLAVVVNTPEPRVARRAMLAVASHVVGRGELLSPDAAERLAPLILALLDHSDPAIAFAAARVAETVLATRPLPALRERVAALALTTLERDVQALAMAPLPVSCGLGPPPEGWPGSFQAQVVHTAAKAGDLRTFEPLLAEMTRLLAAPAHRIFGDEARHHALILTCLALLAPRLDADRARRLHGLLAGQYESAAFHPWAGSSPLERALHGLFATVPEDLLPWYDGMLADPWQHRACAGHLARAGVVLPPQRLARVLPPLAECTAPKLYLQDPGRLVAAWLAGGKQRDHAVVALASDWRAGAARIRESVRRGELPREFAIAATRVYTPRPPDLPCLAELLPDRIDAGSARQLVIAIHGARNVGPDGDVTALRTLATARSPEVGLAAARRAAMLGEPGRALACEIVAGWLTGVDPGVVTMAARLALELDFEAPSLREAVVELRKPNDWSARMVADAVELRFFGLDPRATKSGYPGDAIALARRDVDVDTLREVFAGSLHVGLQRLLSECSATTMAHDLLLAREVPVWNRELEKQVTTCTTHADARVRRAAYTALQSRDRDLWPCALLVHEAAHDPNPIVRDVGR